MYIFITSLLTQFFLLSLIIELPSKVSLFYSKSQLFILCVPSQNGLLFEALHLHNATPRIVESGSPSEFLRFSTTLGSISLGDSQVH
jgi:hypothetical protein